MENFKQDENEVGHYVDLFTEPYEEDLRRTEQRSNERRNNYIVLI